MRIVESCEKCLWDRQVKLAETLTQEGAGERYLAEIRDALYNRDPEACSPYLVYRFRQIFAKYGENTNFPKETKMEYNALVMSMEDKIEEKIESAFDPLEKALIYARIGNYIDFSAVNHVEPEELIRLLEEDSNGSLTPEVYEDFCKECREAKNFVLLCDNCGEIVFDKLFIRQLRKRFPHLNIHIMVRGEDVLNDATMEDAEFCGFTREAEVIPNGNAIAGTVWEMLSPRAKQVIEQADLILSKGQGNYESFYGYHGPVYYSLLCKCDLFIQHFQVPRLTGVFVRELR